MRVALVERCVSFLHIGEKRLHVLQVGRILLERHAGLDLLLEALDLLLQACVVIFYLVAPKSGKMAVFFISASDSDSAYSSTTLSQGESDFNVATLARASRDMTATTTVLLRIAREKPASQLSPARRHFLSQNKRSLRLAPLAVRDMLSSSQYKSSTSFWSASTR